MGAKAELLLQKQEVNTEKCKAEVAIIWTELGNRQTAAIASGFF